MCVRESERDIYPVYIYTYIYAPIVMTSGEFVDCPAQTMDPYFAQTIHGLSQAQPNVSRVRDPTCKLFWFGMSYEY